MIRTFQGWTRADKSRLKKSKEAPLKGTRLRWISTCPAGLQMKTGVLQVIANQDLKLHAASGGQNS